LHKMIALGTYPVLLGGSTLFVATVLQRYPTDRLQETLLVSGVLFSIALVLLVLQRIAPAEQSWRQWRRDWPTDVAHGVLSATMGTAASRVVLFGLMGAVAASSDGLGVWPSHWPLLAQLPLAVVISDFGMYVLHRSSHGVPMLWKVHAVHHSSERLYTLSSGRVHPIYVGLAVLCATGPVLLLGAPPPLFALLSTLVGANGLVQHSNVELDCRPYRWLLATADAHRWHHSEEHPESLCNYGNTLSWWDRLFGTWRLPEGRPARLGLGDPGYPAGWWGQLWRPLRRAQYPSNVASPD
jgi:sterol desaturase/sphingolipid hydroxylase (fatty acid hydroxylase superfamily)